MSIKTILLTGCTGFIGSHLLKELDSLGYNILALQRSFSDIWRLEKEYENVIFYDIDRYNLLHIFEDNKIDCIMHLATDYKKNETIDNIAGMLYSNVTFPSILLEYSIIFNVPYFINTGTFFERHYKNLYARNKIMFEDNLKKYCKAKQIKGLTLKLFSPYGPKDNDKVMPMIIKKCLQGNLIELYDADQKCNFMYIDDVVDAFIHAISYIKDSKKNYEAIDIYNDEDYTLDAVCDICNEITGNHLGIINHRYTKDRIKYKKIKNRNWKWKPKVSLKEGISKTISYYKGLQNDN